MKISLLLFEEVDLLDTGGPYEVFLTASRLSVRDGKEAPFDVSSVTVDGGPVTAYGGLGLTPNGDFELAMQSDVLVVPGTIDIDKAMSDDLLVQSIARYGQTLGEHNRVIASVCTGAFLLAKAGLLNGKSWTTHFEDVDLLAQSLDIAEGATSDKRWIDEGSIVTAGGLSTGIDMSLHLVERFASRDLAIRTAKQIEYDWQIDRL